MSRVQVSERPLDGDRGVAAQNAVMVAVLRSAPGGVQDWPEVPDTFARDAATRYGGRAYAEDREAWVCGFDAPDTAFGFASDIASHVLEQIPNGPAPAIGLHDVKPATGRDFGSVDEAASIARRLANFAHGGGIVASGTALAAMAGALSRIMRPVGTLTPRVGARPVEVFRADEPNRLDGGGEILCFGAYELDTQLFELRHEGSRVPVEPMTFDLLALLARNAYRTVSRHEVFTALWGERIVSDAALSSQVKAARRAVGDHGAAQHTIATVHARGFRFVREVTCRGAAAPPAHFRSGPERLARGRPVVAVLPFADLGQSEDRDFFADCLSEDIITSLAKTRWLAVIARNPAFSFRDADLGFTEIGEQLGARYLVTGSVRRADCHVRIAVQLADAQSGHCLWSERLTRELADIFALEEKVSSLISGRLATELGVAEQRRAQAQSGEDVGAWERYQLGSAEFYRFTDDGNRRCQALLREAIAQDPDFAAAHSRLAYAIILEMVYFDGGLDQSRFDEALRVARHAVALDDQDANSYFVLGRVHLARCEYDRAIAALEHGLELNPCLALTHCGLGESFAYEDRIDEAIRHFEAAVELSPHDPFRWAFYAYRSLAHLFATDFAAAAHWARRATEVPNAHYWARAHLVAALGHLGDKEQARRERAELLHARPDFSRAFVEERLFYVKKREQRDLYLAGLARAGIQ